MTIKSVVNNAISSSQNNIVEKNVSPSLKSSIEKTQSIVENFSLPPRDIISFADSEELGQITHITINGEPKNYLTPQELYDRVPHYKMSSTDEELSKNIDDAFDRSVGISSSDSSTFGSENYEGLQFGTTIDKVLSSSQEFFSPAAHEPATNSISLTSNSNQITSKETVKQIENPYSSNANSDLLLVMNKYKTDVEYILDTIKDTDSPDENYIVTCMSIQNKIEYIKGLPGAPLVEADIIEVQNNIHAIMDSKKYSKIYLKLQVAELRQNDLDRINNVDRTDSLINDIATDVEAARSAAKKVAKFDHFNNYFR